MMKRMSPWLIAAAVVAIAALPQRRAAADDETDDTGIKIHAALDAVSCGDTQQTITVLGLTIDVTNASIGAGDDGSDGSGASDSGDSSSDGESGDDTGGTVSGCAGLVVGQAVEVKLSSDSVPLVATEVSQGGGEEIKIEAPIQNVDPAGTIAVLGLVVDVSQANAEGADDDASDGGGQPIDLTQLAVGQFVELKLASAQAPLSATELQVKNFMNQVDVEVDDSTGVEVDDMDDNGNADDDVDVQVDETVVVQNPAAATASTRKRVKKVVRLHVAKNGSFTIGGLPTGRAKITVTRTHAGVTTIGRRAVAVHPNLTKHVRLRLRLHKSN